MNQATEHQASPASNTNKDKDQKRKMSGRKKGGLFVVILLLVGFIIINRSEPVETIDCTPEIIASKPDVIMLGAWWCSYCYKAKKYFQRNNIHYCEYDMESTITGKRLYQEHGGGAVPILLIGDYQLSGFNEQQVESALSLINKDSTHTK
ncbi:MAG: glutaredoxin family protein [Gammaproteobacteria bacterium]